jgi:hypothetical protein
VKLGGGTAGSERSAQEAAAVAERMRPVMAELADLSSLAAAAELTERKWREVARGDGHPRARAARDVTAKSVRRRRVSPVIVQAFEERAGPNRIAKAESLGECSSPWAHFPWRRSGVVPLGDDAVNRRAVAAASPNKRCVSLRPAARRDPRRIQIAENDLWPARFGAEGSE